MKTKPLVVNNLQTIVITAVVLVPLVACAQPSPREIPENRPPLQRGAAIQERLAMINPQGDFGMLRVLTEEQRASFREAMEAQGDQMRPIAEKLRVARQEAMAAALAEEFDENTVRKKALEVGKLEAEMAVLRARALHKVKPPLSAKQIEQIKNPPPFNPAGNQFRPPRRVDRPPVGPRDENDLPPKPKSD